MVNLVSVINKAGREENLDQLVLPARHYLSSVAQGLETTIREQTEAKDAALPEASRSSKTLNRELSDAKALRDSVKGELIDALPVERAGLHRDLTDVNNTIKKLEKQLKKAVAPITESEMAIERGKKQSAAESEYLQKVIGVYPHAQIIDLQCLALLRGKDGLPALTLYNPNYTHSIVYCYFGIERMVPSYGMVYNSSDTGKHSVHLKIVNASISDADNGVEEPFSSQKYAVAEVNKSISKGMGKVIQHATGLTVGTDVVRTSLTAQFSEKFKVIPKDARQLIREASKNNSLFDKVLLLAEVPRWDIQYLRQRGVDRDQFKPKLQGTVLEAPRSDDPLILGTKKVGDKVLAVMIGAFDTTPVEHYARSEFAERIKEPHSKTS